MPCYLVEHLHGAQITYHYESSDWIVILPSIRIKNWRIVDCTAACVEPEESDTDEDLPALDDIEGKEGEPKEEKTQEQE
jgi:hypothetical protein